MLSSRGVFRITERSEWPVQGPELELIGTGRHQGDDRSGGSQEHVGWGGNLRAMHEYSEEASHLDHPPFRPTLLSEPGTRSALALALQCHCHLPIQRRCKTDQMLCLRTFTVWWQLGISHVCVLKPSQ